MGLFMCGDGRDVNARDSVGEENTVNLHKLAGRMNTPRRRPVCGTMALTTLFLSPAHELVAADETATAARFDGNEQVLVVLDDHHSPRMRVEFLPNAPELGDYLPELLDQIRTSAHLDALEAVRDILIQRGIPELTADAVVEATVPLLQQPAIPEGWTAWGQIPRGSLSSLGDGTWLLIWPEADAAGHDMAFFDATGVDNLGNISGPELTYRPNKRGAAFVRVARTGLTSSQIALFMAGAHEGKGAFDPAAVFDILLTEAA